MKNIYLTLIICVILLFNCNVYSQSKYLQFNVSSGATIPIQDSKSSNMFCENGWNAQGNFEMFFGKIGLGLTAGYQSLFSHNKFTDFIVTKFNDNSSISTHSWKNTFLLVGPTLKLGSNRFEIDIFTKIGLSQIDVPNLYYRKNFFGQNYEIASFSGSNPNLTPLWLGGVSLHYRLPSNFSFFINSSILSTQFIGKVNSLLSYRDAIDSDRNGVIDDTEFFEAAVVNEVKENIFSNVNLNFGVSYQIGRVAKQKDAVKMLSLEDNIKNNESEYAENKVKNNEKILNEVFGEERIVAIDNKKDIKQSDTPKDNQNMTSEVNKSQQTEVEPYNNQEPESSEITEYDLLGGQFLYKAGESYFQNNDYENAVACFVKLKNDVNHPMAKYMFALSLCEMLNCEEALEEYEQFAQNYNQDNAGVLRTVFLANQEKCKQRQLELEELTASNTPNIQKIEESKIEEFTGVTSKNKEEVKKPSAETLKGDASTPKNIVTYKIQFVALKISDKSFPKLQEIGSIKTEFYPKNAMYRYNLGPYLTEEEAVSDMMKVRSLGFKDAFLAVYKNGKRTNTLFHAK